MLQLSVVPQTEQLQAHIILQRDCAPVRAYVDKKFPGRQTGREGALPWPPRSLDIKPLGFFMWGYAKSIVYWSPLTGTDDLKKGFTEAMRTSPSE